MQHQLQSVVANGSDRWRTGPSRAEIQLTQARSNCKLCFPSGLQLCGALAERAGFKGLWESGLLTAHSLGYRDRNEASRISSSIGRMHTRFH